MTKLILPTGLNFGAERLLEESLTDTVRWASRRTMIPHDGVLKPFSLFDYPFAVEPMNSNAKEIYWPKSAQMGVTSIAVRKALKKLVKDQHSGMYVLPRGNEVEDFSKTRIYDECIKTSPYLKARIDASVRVYRYGHAALYMAGATKDANLKSKPVLFMVLDEADEIRERAVGLARTRLMGQNKTQFLMFSTPTYPGQGIDSYWPQTSQKHYFFRCGKCSKLIFLTYPDDFVLGGASLEDGDVSKSHWKCCECKRQLPNAAERGNWYRESGIWVPKNMNADNGREGYYIHRGYSTIKSDADFGMEVHLSRLSNEKNREFHNSIIGKAYSDDAAQITEADINGCLKEYFLHKPDNDKGFWCNGFPKDFSDIITLGIDQGDTHFWVAIKYWLDHTLIGDVIDRCRGRLIGYGHTFDREAPWAEIPSVIHAFKPFMIGVDIDDDRRGARSLARQYRKRCFPIDYVRGRPAREIRVDDEDGDVPTAKSDRTAWIGATFNFIKTNRLELPTNIDPVFRKHLKGLTLQLSYLDDGTPVRVYKRLDNSNDHWLHAIGYSLHALKLYETHGVRFGSDVISSVRG